MKLKFFSDNAKAALVISKVFLCAAILGLVASFQISIMSSPAHAIKQYSLANGNIACSSCHSKKGLSNGTMYPLTSNGAYFKTNGTLAPRAAAPVPAAPPYAPPARPYTPPQRPVYQQPQPQRPVYQQPQPQRPVYQQPRPQRPVYQQPQRPVYQQPQRPTVNLAYPLQRELKRLGCLRGRVDGVWGRGSRAALTRFARQARLRLGNQPSQNALNVAQRTPSGYCPPVRPVYNPPRYNPPRVNNPPRRNQTGNYTCSQAKRLIQRRGYGRVRAQNCNDFGRYTFYGHQGGNRYRLRIRASDGVIYKRQLR